MTRNRNSGERSRRNVLRAVGTASAGLIGLGAASGSATAKDDGDCDNPPWHFPRVTTRGHFDTTWYGSVYRTNGNTDTNYDGDGIPGVHSDAPDELVVFVHGWNTEQDEALCTFNTAAGTFTGEDYQHPVVGYSWDSDYSWGNGQEIAAENGPKLATFVTDYAADNPGTALRLVGHSLGCRVICEALTHLDSWGTHEAVSSVSFLGGAVDYDAVNVDGPFGPAIDRTVDTADNFWMEDDGVLNWAYQTAEWSAAIGNSGAAGETTANYTDHNVAYVDGHGGYYQPDGCIHEVIDAFY